MSNIVCQLVPSKIHSSYLLNMFHGMFIVDVVILEKMRRKPSSRKRSKTHRNYFAVTDRLHFSRVDTKTHPSMCGWPLGDNICLLFINWQEGYRSVTILRESDISIKFIFYTGEVYKI